MINAKKGKNGKEKTDMQQQTIDSWTDDIQININEVPDSQYMLPLCPTTREKFFY